MNILYEDRDLIVVEKPSGIPVETRRIGTPDMTSLLKNHLSANGPGSVPYLGIVHRLDQPVQGVMVFAKNSKAAGALCRQIIDGTMEKIYLAVTTGVVPEHASLTDYLLKDGRTNTSRIVPEGTKDAKPARLDYEPLAVLESEQLSLVKIHLFTGRHHQIRVQMAGAGFPLYGDQKYNPLPAGRSVALCACRLTFLHPATEKKCSFFCRPSGDIFSKFSCALSENE